MKEKIEAMVQNLRFRDLLGITNWFQSKFGLIRTTPPPSNQGEGGGTTHSEDELHIAEAYPMIA